MSKPKSFSSFLLENKEYILWGTPKGKTDAFHEVVLYTQGKTSQDIERVKALAKKEGWHSFRVQIIDNSKAYDPLKDFASTVVKKNKK